MRHIVGFLLIFFCLIESGYSMTLKEIVDYALKNNSELNIARQEEEKIKGQIKKSELLLINNPIIEIDFSKKSESPDNSSTGYNNYKFNIYQEIEVADQRKYRTESVRKNYEKFIFEIKEKERSLVSEIKESFIKSLILQKKEALLKDVLSLKEEILDYVHHMFKSGEVSTLEVNIAEVEVNKAKKDLILIRKELKESLLFLQRLAGVNPDETFFIEGDIEIDNILIPEKEYIKKSALENRPDLKSILAEIEKAKADISLANKQKIPNVTLSAYYEKDEGKNVYGISFSVPIPIFDQKQQEIAEAFTNLSQAKIRYDSIVKTIEKEVLETYNNLLSALDEINIFKKELIDKTSENLSLLNLAFKEGKISFYDVRLAQKDALEVKMSYLDAILRAQIALNNLEKITGGLK